VEYVRTRKTGLKVSRICLGTMTYGTSACALDTRRGREPPFIKRGRSNLGNQLLRTADMYRAAMSEEVLGRALGGVRGARSVVNRHQSVQSDGDGPERSRPSGST